MDTLFRTCYAKEHTQTFVPAYMLLANKRTTYFFCISGLLISYAFQKGVLISFAFLARAHAGVPPSYI